MVDAAYIRARCVEDGDCLIYQGNHCKGVPRVSVRINGKSKTVQCRRVLWQEERGPIPKGKRVTTTCGHQSCMAHLALATGGQIVSREAKRPDVKARRYLAALAVRQKMGKLTLEKAREIRSSDKTAAELAKIHNVSESTIHAARNRQRYKEFTNPFQGLM